MEQIIAQMRNLKLVGMADYLATADIPSQQLTNLEWLELLLHQEVVHKKNTKIKRLLKNAELRSSVRLEDIQHDDSRGFTRYQLLSLMKLEFLTKHQNLVITGATGCGKTYLACAVGNKACIEGYKVRFIKLPTFLEEIKLHRSIGTFPRLLNVMLSYDLLILDDFGLTSIEPQQLQDLFNIIDERYQLKSTIITSQLPTSSWHDYLGNPTIADAILDRILSQADNIPLVGDSLRWKNNKKKEDKNDLN